MAFTRASIGELVCDYAAARRWLETSCGEERVQVSRFGRYSDDLEAVNNALLNERPLSGDEGARFAVAFEESMYLISAHQGLEAHNQREELRERLSRIIGGAETRINDRPGNIARNTAFELSIASRLSQVGYEVDFSSVTDVIANRDGFDFIIECKRPNSIAAVRRNFERAMGQLRTRLANRAEAHGVIALSSSVAMNPTGGFLRVQSIDELRETVSNLQRVFRQQIIDAAQGINRRNRVPQQYTGSISEFIGVAEVGDEALPTNTYDMEILPARDVNGPISRIADALGAYRALF
jgi:hypothetical protein